MSTLRPRPGFTLIEVITVLAIIGILAAIGIGATRNAKERALAISLAADVAAFRTAALEAADFSGRNCAARDTSAAAGCTVRAADLVEYLTTGFANLSGKSLKRTNAGVTMEFVAADDPSRVLMKGRVATPAPALRLTANGPQATRVLAALKRDLPPGSFSMQSALDITSGYGGPGGGSDFQNYLTELWFTEMPKYPANSPEAKALRVEYDAVGNAAGRCMTDRRCSPYVSAATGDAIVVLW